MTWRKRSWLDFAQDSTDFVAAANSSHGFPSGKAFGPSAVGVGSAHDPFLFFAQGKVQ